MSIKSLIYKGKYDEIKKLLNKDKKIAYIRDYNNELPIHLACRTGNDKIIELFYKLDNRLLNTITDFLKHLK